MALSAKGSSWAIATPHTLATEAGASAFRGGGNAIDAALAAAVTLTAVYPHMCGVGGDLFALVARPEGDVLTIVSAGAAPRGQDVGAVRRAGGGRMPERGPLSITVPGAVAGWEAVHGRGGALPWDRAFGTGIAAARDGVPVSRSLAGSIGWDADVLARDPDAAAIYLPDGYAIKEGGKVRQPALASTLETIARDGPATLYEGELGKLYSEGLQHKGSALAPEDLSAHRAETVPPLLGRYRELDVRVAPPPSQGFALLEALAVIERLGIDPDPFGPDAGTMALAYAAAARDRDQHLADPAAMRVHPATLLDDGHIAALCDEVRQGPSLSHRASGGDTTGLVTADAEGFAVSLIQSLSWGFGSGILEPVTGIMAQNRGSGFTLDEDHPNVFEPGKRPAHTLMPVMAHRGGALWAVSGTMGGPAHPQINATSLIRAFDEGMTPEEAVGLPRWLVDGLDEPTDEPTVVAEEGVPASAIESLRSAGYAIKRLDHRSEETGHAHLILLSADGVSAGTDPRADGSALAG